MPSFGDQEVIPLKRGEEGLKDLYLRGIVLRFHNMEKDPCNRKQPSVYCIVKTFSQRLSSNIPLPDRAKTMEVKK